MKTNIGENIGSRLFRGFFSLFSKEEHICETNPAEIITNELDGLWEVTRAKAAGLYSEMECVKKITDSFREVRCRFSNEQIDSAYAWPRYVKIAIHCVDEPIPELVDYVNESNYIRLTKHLSDLSYSVYKGGEEGVKANMEKFSESVYLHILEDINPEDVPSCLALGRMCQKNAEYDEARQWFGKILNTEDPFNGITALLACYEEETKAVLTEGKNRYSNDSKREEKVRMLNESQCSVYDKWCRITEERINGSDEVTEQCKREYVSLMTGYARFERNRGDFDKAFELLRKIPRTYPDIYRVYTEEAMIYQFKPYKNHYYSLEKAIEAFRMAEKAISCSDAKGTSGAKSKKSILMPLANTYYQSGRYVEAASVCDNVLKIDVNEQRAINLKNKIARMAA